MGVDIRLPIGLMFTVLGLLLTLYGLFTAADSELYKISFNININLWTGIVTLLFGVLMLIFSRNRKKKGEGKEQVNFRS
ncbi:MAG: hypothetical protein JSV24_00560 [Bacteroidales bacterium]|nr:MAG: hypothetical protein JSV24_00560 [Bacteroidales bacterium]